MKKLVKESLNEFKFYSHPDIEEFSIKNQPHVIPVLDSISSYYGTDVQAKIESAFGEEVYYIGCMVNEEGREAEERVRMVEELIQSLGHRPSKVLKIAKDHAFELRIYHQSDGSKFGNLTEGYANSWYANAKGMLTVLNATRQA